MYLFFFSGTTPVVLFAADVFAQCLYKGTFSKHQKRIVGDLYLSLSYCPFLGIMAAIFFLFGFCTSLTKSPVTAFLQPERWPVSFNTVLTCKTLGP